MPTTLTDQMHTTADDLSLIQPWIDIEDRLITVLRDLPPGSFARKRLALALADMPSLVFFNTGQPSGVAEPQVGAILAHINALIGRGSGELRPARNAVEGALDAIRSAKRQQPSSALPPSPAPQDRLA